MDSNVHKPVDHDLSISTSTIKEVHSNGLIVAIATNFCAVFTTVYLGAPRSLPVKINEYLKGYFIH